MKLKANKDSCKVIQDEIWNVGDYNVHIVEVELSSDFDELVNKVRYFVGDNCYDMLINNGIAQIPVEATKQEGFIEIGVYGFEADTDVLIESTMPIKKYIMKGTYTGDADNTEPLTPTDKQQMETEIQKNTDDIEDIKSNLYELVAGENIILTKQGNKIIISATGVTPPVTEGQLLTSDDKIFVTINEENFILKEEE